MGSDTDTDIDTRAMETPAPYLLRGIELATALVYGSDQGVRPLDLSWGAPPPRVVLEDILVAALRRGPCVVGFSGGRDSSALLALAAFVARREGLDPPIAASNIFPGDKQAAEAEWQELLIRHVGIQHWERLVFTEEMDVIGPVARPFLRRFGPTFPFNGHFGLPSFALARGGTYITGVGGDELFEPNEVTRLALVLSGRLRPSRIDLPIAMHALGPRRYRIRYWKRLIPDEPWLRREISAASQLEMARILATQKVWCCDQIRFDIWRDTARAALLKTLKAFAATVGANIVQPFQEPTFLAAVAAHRGRVPWRGRAAAMADLFGDILPRTVVRRATKASFDSIFFNQPSRDFVRNWDGSGVDPTLVDIPSLRAAWNAPEVDARSLSLLQAAWYHSSAA